MSSRRALRRAGRVSPRAGSRRGRRALVLAAAGGPAPEPEHIFDTLGATWWIDAAEETTGGATSACQWALNRGNQAVPHARLGSTGRAELRGSYGLVLPGVSGNYASAPDSAALSITGDLDICADVTLVDWTPSANNVIACKGDASTQDSYYLRVNTSGSLELAVINAAGSYITGVSSVAPTVTDGAPLWVRGTVDIDNGANSVFKFYTSSDGSSWTQLGTTQTSTRITTSVRNGTSMLNVGCYVSGVQHLTGAIRRVIIKNGYDGAGSTVFDADFTAATAFATSFTESSSNAAMVTINATSGADTNDPLLLTHTGTNYLYLPGLTGNDATSPDSAALDVADDIEIIVRVTIGSISTNQGIVSKFTASNWVYELRVQSTDLFFYGSGNGTSTTLSTVSGAHGLSVGDTVWLRVTRVKSTGVNTIYKAADQASIPTSWTQIATQTLNAGASFFNGANPVQIGSSGGSSFPFAGSIYRAIIRSSIGGTAVFDADFTTNTDQSSFTESSSNAATVTINRATSGRKSVMVTRPVWLFGTDDYMEVPDQALLDVAAGESLSAVIVMREWATGSGNTCFLSKYQGAFDEGWGLIRVSGSPYQARAYLESGASSVEVWAPSAYSAGVAVLSGAHIDRDAQTVRASVGSSLSGTTSIAALGSIANAGQLRIGGNAASGDYLNGEVLAVAVFKGSTLDSTALASIASYFGV